MALLLASPASAFADSDKGFEIGAKPAWFLMAGLTSGGTVAVDDRGAFVGGEMSVSRLKNASYLGIYADGYYDFGPDGWYLTAGPLLGKVRRSAFTPTALGLDGGVAVRFADGDSQLGGTIRGSFIVTGAVSLYARYLHFGTSDNEQIVQVGITFKYPLVKPFGAGAN
ncbi:MAG: hypothetical protein AAGC55_11395 [Myxococcota bacterium]